MDTRRLRRSFTATPAYTTIEPLALAKRFDVLPACLAPTRPLTLTAAGTLANYGPRSRSPASMRPRARAWRTRARPDLRNRHPCAHGPEFYPVRLRARSLSGIPAPTGPRRAGSRLRRVRTRHPCAHGARADGPWDGAFAGYRHPCAHRARGVRLVRHPGCSGRHPCAHGPQSSTWCDETQPSPASLRPRARGSLPGRQTRGWPGIPAPTGPSRAPSYRH